MPPHLAEVRAADLNGDGRAELILASKTPKAGQPDSVSLTLVSFDEAGRELGRQALDLDRRPLLWDVEGDALLAVDGEGALRLRPGGSSTRLLSTPTPLAGLGRTTPLAADIAHDLDGDGIAELLLWSGGRTHAVDQTGKARGSIAAPARGALREDERAGGRALHIAATPPTLVVGDFDGDGRADLALPEGARLVVHFTGDRIGDRSATWTLPKDLDPPERTGPKATGPRQELVGAWFRDMDGDGRLDLLLHEAVLDGSWFGSTAALTVHLNTGAGFGPPHDIRTPAAAVELQTLDWEGDGDLDLLVPQVDVGMGNLGRALLARRVQVEAWLYRWQGAGFEEAPVLLRTLSLPIERSESYHAELRWDFNGDGVLDLLTDEGEDRLRIHAGRREPLKGAAFDDSPLLDLALPVPDVASPFFVRDLTGDGRPELLLWSPGAPQATLIRLP